MKIIQCRFVFGLLLTLALSGCVRSPAPQPVTEYQMHGEVVGLDTSAQLAKVKHEKIEGWMEAMTMEYPLKDKQEFQKLKVGETIQAKILVQGTDFWIAAVTPDVTRDVTPEASSNAVPGASEKATVRK